VGECPCIVPAGRPRGLTPRAQVFLLCFAPLTKAAIDQLMCVESCAAGVECAQVLAIDYGVSCTGGAGEFRAGAIAAVVVLVLLGLLVPAWLARAARRSRKARNAALAMRVADMERWFEQLDADGSGSLEGEELRTLLFRMGRPSTDQAVRIGFPRAVASISSLLHTIGTLVQPPWWKAGNALLRENVTATAGPGLAGGVHLSAGRLAQGLGTAAQRSHGHVRDQGGRRRG
jgi:hypothetical protein